VGVVRVMYQILLRMAKITSGDSLKSKSMRFEIRVHINLMPLRGLKKPKSLFLFR